MLTRSPPQVLNILDSAFDENLGPSMVTIVPLWCRLTSGQAIAEAALIISLVSSQKAGDMGMWETFPKQLPGRELDDWSWKVWCLLVVLWDMQFSVTDTTTSWALPLCLQQHTSPVYERIQDHKVSRFHFLLEGPTGCGGQNVGDSELLQTSNVGSAAKWWKVKTIRARKKVFGVYTNSDSGAVSYCMICFS